MVHSGHRTGELKEEVSKDSGKRFMKWNKVVGDDVEMYGNGFKYQEIE